MLLVVFANLDAAYLAADGLGQLVHKLDDTRIFVGGGDALHVVLKLLDEGVAGLVLVGLGEYDGGLDNLAADFVGHAGDGTLYDGGMGHQCAFHFERTDAVA